MVGIRLASGVVTPLVKKLFRGEGAGAGLVDRPVRISSYVSLRERRGLSGPQLQRLADKLVEEALQAPGESPLPPAEAEGVAAALVATLHSLGDITLEDVEAVEMGAAKFARELRRAAPATGLGRDAELLHDRLLELTCLHVLHFFTTRSTYIPRALVEHSRRQGETIAKIDALLARVPRQDGRDPAFERDYLGYVTDRHSTLTVFGLDLPPGSARWPLDVAYVSLEVLWRPQDGDEAAASPYTASADRALTYNDRALLRGEAGSGKTTLIKWLAVSAARGDQGNVVPYVLPMRTLSRHGGPLPTPEEFLAAVGCMLAGEQPRGWVSRVLRDRRGLVLVDGIDEIPETERARAREWLTELITAYPGNRWLVTSRPSAVRQNWLADERFAELTLSPMNRTEVGAFITRWHRAADAGDQLRDQLTDSLRTKPDLARLTTNPLLCALICALHRERRGFLPSGRKELYTAALSMMLYRRDKERDLRLPELAEEPALQLLQRLAYWLIRNGRTEMGRGRAEELIAAALPAVPLAGAYGDAPAVLRHFLERTGLLRAPTEDTLEFLHRTFQDFLGARAALDEGGLGELTRHADDDQWEDVIRMAVAQGRPLDRAAIIGDLLIRNSDRSVLLAFACLEYAAELDPGLRADVEEAAKRLIPPKTRTAALTLGACGPMVLDLLPGPEEGLSEEAAHLTVIAAGSSGTDFAIPFLAGFATHPSWRVRNELAERWPLFDSRAYAEEVLARIDPPPRVLAVTSDAALDALREYLPPAANLWVQDEVSPEALERYLRQVQVRQLDLHLNSTLTDLGFLRGQEALRSVQITECTGLRNLDGLHGLALDSFALATSQALSVGHVIGSWPSLRGLSLFGQHIDWSFDDLHPAVALTRLGLDRAPTSWAGLGLQHELWRLELRCPVDGPAWEVVAALPRLEHLVVEDLDEVPAGLRFPTVRTLRPGNPQVTLDPVLVARHFPRLVRR